MAKKKPKSSQSRTSTSKKDEKIDDLSSSSGSEKHGKSIDQFHVKTSRSTEREESYSSHIKKDKKGKPGLSKICVAITSILVIFVALFAYNVFNKWQLTNRVVTPHPAPWILDLNSTSPSVSPEKFWGSYRPQVYFGMKTRSPKSIVTGLMWMHQFGIEGQLRHNCEQGDGLPRYGWLMHDGVHFGVQEIVDFGFSLTTEFLKRPGGLHGGDWTWRITAKQSEAPVISLLFYVATDGQGILQPHVEGQGRLAYITGFSEELGEFKVIFQKPTDRGSKVPKYASYNYLKAQSPGLHKLTDIVKSSLSGHFVYSPPSGESQHYFAVHTYRPPPQNQMEEGGKEQSHFLVHQVTLQVPFQIEIRFESGSFITRPSLLMGEVFTEEMEKQKALFNERFEKTFPLQEKGYTQQQIVFAKAALSNMLGGMGFFFGTSVVQSKYNPHPVAYWETPLYTAVPSRSFFPRGFLWDEGFHQLLISKWDREISKDVIAHWLDLMNVEGWIPREVILDAEARSRVPPEFIVQRNENANPPTLFLALQKIIGNHNQGVTEADKSYLRKIFPRLKTWFSWYNTTQTGTLPFTYRWRGRDIDTNLFLNPKTLTSGLDDYPRASHPSDDERHVDLRCWMALASRIMSDVAMLLGEPHEEYETLHAVLSNISLLEELHWSEDLKIFADYGNHTPAVVLEREKIFIQPGQQKAFHPSPRLVRVVRRQPKLQYVGAFGYVSLFPFLLQLLPPDSPKLEKTFRDMRMEKKLWTPYGLRSLSKSSPLYMKHNTEHDGPYWRGAIWININYLAVRALYHYSKIEGPYKQMAASLYQELRTNVITNVYRQYMTTGYIYEQYNDSTGEGQSSFPFTGWSALVVLMMAEEY
ncbi:mannosyl-oligosaccharide glucosidase [Protopterus annectens]|uniref:mannosyl-oligosaccharide glucosidase n=1 Tax=Protopterus annectens TaxID=7888 RepID=UPI001CFAA416|nr:mannosyl-oligosaccharide glucosidase [Protopterus annectens]XP_043919947.1 mannosyl-oligosaccharide glucosidase [Protopterus annectens]